MPNSFWASYETIAESTGFAQFTLPHFIELIVTAVIVCGVTILYVKSDAKRRNLISLIFVILVVADELFKHISLLINGLWLPDYLPLHLCSVNIFFIVIYHFTKSKLFGNFLWGLCIPGALLALLFPTWKSLPVWNFMHLHSLSIHILLLTYPIMSVVSKEVKRDYRKVPAMLGILAIAAVPALMVNLLYNTNFMFLMRAPQGSPLAWFEGWFGNHLWGFAVLLPLILAVMYIPFKKPKD